MNSNPNLKDKFLAVFGLSKKYKVESRYPEEAEVIARIARSLLSETAQNMKHEGQQVSVDSLLLEADAIALWKDIREQSLIYDKHSAIIRRLIKEHPVQNRFRLWFNMRLIGEC
jgi:hypothetical protein